MALQREYGAEADPFDLWEAYIAGRNFAGAAALLDAPDPLVTLLAEVRARIDRERDAEAHDLDTNLYLATALVTAVEGDTAETERLVRVSLHEATHDLAEPSQVTPFFEPFLPYCDALRNDPALLEFLVEIRGV